MRRRKSNIAKEKLAGRRICLHEHESSFAFPFTNAGRQVILGCTTLSASSCKLLLGKYMLHFFYFMKLIDHYGYCIIIYVWYDIIYIRLCIHLYSKSSKWLYDICQPKGQLDCHVAKFVQNQYAWLGREIGDQFKKFWPTFFPFLCRPYHLCYYERKIGIMHWHSILCG